MGSMLLETGSSGQTPSQGVIIVNRVVTVAFIIINITIIFKGKQLAPLCYHHAKWMYITTGSNNSMTREKDYSMSRDKDYSMTREKDYSTTREQRLFHDQGERLFHDQGERLFHDQGATTIP